MYLGRSADSDNENGSVQIGALPIGSQRAVTSAVASHHTPADLGRLLESNFRDDIGL